MSGMLWFDSRWKEVKQELVDVLAKAWSCHIIAPHYCTKEKRFWVDFICKAEPPVEAAELLLLCGPSRGNLRVQQRGI